MVYQIQIQISKKNEREDARALFYIQLAVHDTIFSKIAAASNAKEAWTNLKIAFQESIQVTAIKLQGLRRDFEKLQMNKEETMQKIFQEYKQWSIKSKYLETPWRKRLWW
jgi:gag-polypeptide of LTR copia-type